MSTDLRVKRSPPLSIPGSNQCCRLSIINTTTDITGPPHSFVEPDIPGYEWINMPTFAFYVKHDQSGRQLLFDLGCRKDWQNSVPHIAELIAKVVSGFKVTKDVVDILPEGNVSIDNVEALVLSHWHYDHIGNIDALPKSTKLVVGPGFREAFLPGYPSRKDSPFYEADFMERDVIEALFSSDFRIGQFDAHDYFGDGSFYILNTPGHATGHISALVRTTPDTLVFLGGDICHFTGSIRPTEYLPLPDMIPPETALDRQINLPCPCAAFLSGHRDPSNARTTPFFSASTDPNSFYDDPLTAQQSQTSLTEFDADPNILVAIAHDPTSLDVFDFFPATMNDWKAKGWKGWKEKSHWGFLSELPYNGRTVRKPLVDGLYKDGVKIRGLKD